MQKRSSSCILNYMPGDFLARLTASPVLCDGAMGTLLYSKGIFINRCYDELNVSQPDLIRGIHHDDRWYRYKLSEWAAQRRSCLFLCGLDLAAIA